MLNFSLRIFNHLQFIVTYLDRSTTCTQRYVSGLSELLDSYAPLVQRTQISKPQTIWYNQTIREAKQVRRKLERVWGRTELHAHHEAYRKQ